MKAKFVRSLKDRYGKYIDLEYEYRGHSYFIRKHFAGNADGESLRDQHLAEQKNIDEMIERSETAPTAPAAGTFDADEIFRLYGWD